MNIKPKAGGNDPTASWPKMRRKLTSAQKRKARAWRDLSKLQQRAERLQQQISQLQAELLALDEWLAYLEADNMANPNPGCDGGPH